MTNRLHVPSPVVVRGAAVGADDPGLYALHGVGELGGRQLCEGREKAAAAAVLPE